MFGGVLAHQSKTSTFGRRLGVGTARSAGCTFGARFQSESPLTQGGHSQAMTRALEVVDPAPMLVNRTFLTVNIERFVGVPHPLQMYSYSAATVEHPWREVTVVTQRASLYASHDPPSALLAVANL